MPSFLARGLLAAALSLAASVRAEPTPTTPAAAGATTLRFVRDGHVVATLDLPALREACRTEVVEIDDPYYQARKTFQACPLRRVLELGFGSTDAIAGEDVLLRARDGYVKPAAGSRLLEEGAYLAYADAQLTGDGPPRWAPIDRRQVDPAPYYLVWTKPAQRDPHRYPWPYQLVTIEVASIEAVYPHIAPRSAPTGSPAWAGFAIFRTECIACHAINGEGGTVGPDLNVPQSIVEYRPVGQIKAYVRDPATFRYGAMPAHPHLTDRQLDELIAYFTAMKDLKHDPRRAP
ncbi:MAG TPA: cytochrome c [Candidatus Limnocylindria bacterium]|nr:cytochrome c [Candidatus Limnocylindria bacterium]